MRLEEQADRILEDHGAEGLICRSWHKYFDPFAPPERGRGSPILRKKGAKGRCRTCAGPATSYGTRCRACITGMPSRVVDPLAVSLASVVDYWLRLWAGEEPDFSLVLIESITQREHELGLPAARWSASETVGL